jgi:spore maturation protein B
MVMGAWIEAVGRLSSYLIPLVMCAVGFLMLRGKRPYFEVFVEGARTGLETAVRLCPTLTALLVAIGMLRASGAVEVVGRWLAPAFDALGVPGELLPLLLTRPFSGSAATAGFASLLEACGPDSFAAACAAVIMGSSDTAVYVITLYFSSIGVKKTRYAMPVALFLMLFCTFFCCLIVRLCLK